jgi:hypothetical protein
VTKVITASVGAADTETEEDVARLPDSLWETAQQILINDKDKKKIWNTYLEYLKSEQGLDLKYEEVVNPQRRLCTILDAKKRELENGKLKIRFGDHSFGVQEALIMTAKHIIKAKDLINAAASASPPAGIACARVFVILTVCCRL